MGTRLRNYHIAILILLTRVEKNLAQKQKTEGHVEVVFMVSTILSCTYETKLGTLVVSHPDHIHIIIPCRLATVITPVMHH